MPLEVIELTRSVSYADLDLLREADVAVLEMRVESAAKMSCEELANKYPLSYSDNWAITRCMRSPGSASSQIVA